MKRKILFGVSLIAAVLLATGLIGWFTSTRHVDMIFSINGVKCDGCELGVLSPSGNGSEEKFKMDRDGCVRLPTTYIGNSGFFCSIYRGDERLILFSEGRFRRGVTRVNFREDGSDSTHFYRFLFIANNNEFSSHRQKIEEQSSSSNGG